MSREADAPERVELKPCPFCGGVARHEWHSSPDCWIECNDCGAVGPNDGSTTTEQNEAAWNTRTPSEAVAEVDAETATEIAVIERAKIVAWLRDQSDKGADTALGKDKGTTARAAYGGGAYALLRAADEIEADAHHALKKQS